MAGPRKVDLLKPARKLPVRVIILGLSRTGTSSICAALRKLGYTPYQMRDLLSDPDCLQIWHEAITLTLLPTSERPSRKKNRTIFPPYGREEFDVLLGEYDAISDMPASLFGKELIEAYPDAKVLVTTREYEEWEESMKGSVWLLFQWKIFVIARTLGVTQIASLANLMHKIFYVHNKNHYGGPKAREAYEKYYADVRELVPADQRLEIESGKGEWEPLIDFLELDLSKEEKEKLGPYPNMKEAGMEKALRSAWWDVVYWFLMMGMVIGSAVLGLVLIYYQAELWAMFEKSLKVFEPYVGFFPRGNGTAAAGGERKDEL